MKILGAFVLPLMFSLQPSARGAEVREVDVPLDAPLSTAEASLPLAELGRHLAAIDQDRSELAPEDQRIILGSALRSLVKASTPGGWEQDDTQFFKSDTAKLSPGERERLDLLQTTYFRSLGGGQVRRPDDPILSVAALDGFRLVYGAVKLVVLHERLNLGWRDLRMAGALLTLLEERTKRSAVGYLTHGGTHHLEHHVRLLAALRQAPELAAGLELRLDYQAFSQLMKHTLLYHLDHELRSSARTPVDAFALASTTTWLAAVAALSPFIAYHMFQHGVPPEVAAHPLAFTAGALMLTAPSLLLNVVTRARLRERRANLESEIMRMVQACEGALL